MVRKGSLVECEFFRKAKDSRISYFKKIKRKAKILYQAKERRRRNKREKRKRYEEVPRKVWFI